MQYAAIFLFLLLNVIFYSSATILTCYITSQLNPSKIDANLCTHLLLIGSTSMNDNSTVVFPSVKFISRYTRLKRINPSLKILITLNPPNDPMSRMVINTELRSKFIADVLLFMEQNKLDGFDFDWEFPSWAPTGGRPSDRAGFAQLLKEISIIFKRNPQREYLLFVTVAAPYTIVDASYNIEDINNYADYVQIMNYDFHVFSPAIPFTGFNAPIHAEYFEYSVLKRMNSDYSTRYWLRGGLNVTKLVFGIPTYGRGYELKLPSAHGLYAPAVGYSSYGEIVGYSTVCAILRDKTQIVGQEWSDRAASPYLYVGSDWISYESDKSVRLKTRYALDLNAAGVMVYALQTDDYLGICNSTQRKTYPLIRSIAQEIREKS